MEKVGWDEWRDLSKRGNEKTEEDRIIARRFDKEFFDGDRKNGYGGYYYNSKFWTEVVKDLNNFYKLKSGSKILDIGCGNGELLRLLSNKKNIDCTGIDFSERAVNLTKDKGINAEVFDIFKDDYKILGDFDYITMFEVLEHIPNAEEA